jgi:cytochrome c-type biogenesis protein CcmF
VKQPQRESLVASFDVTRDGQTVGRFGPRMNYYPSQREPIVTPEVLSRPSYDLYFSLIEVAKGDGATVVVRLIHQPYQMWMWWSAPIIALGSLLALWPQRAKEAGAAPAPAAGAAVAK